MPTRMPFMKNLIIYTCLFLLGCTCVTGSEKTERGKNYSGIYPHLAMYNLVEGECGTGAVVPWANRLWVVTYGQHFPWGSTDKLYEITPDLKMIIRPESQGGTPANRMIHKESNQLFMAHYAIDSQRNVRTIPFSDMQGRMTGSARHLTDPANTIYSATMEEGFYEVDVHSLKVKTLFEDNNAMTDKGRQINKKPQLLPGVHGKGLYSGQGVLVYSNNGEDSKAALTDFDILSGALAEWNGKTWKVIRRCQFVEVTGPGGIYGNSHPDTDPIWATGWDSKSVILGVRQAQTGWTFYRLPKASHSYDGAHGWNTEWPRIRDIGSEGSPDYLMTMHGMFWRFPGTFSTENSAGIRPRSAYLKVIGDFCRWNDQLVFGCDDSALKEFLNVRKIKGKLKGPGQSNSNLWFTSPALPDQLGNTTASGFVWKQDTLQAEGVSDPFIFSGWTSRCLWLKNHSPRKVEIILQTDVQGNGVWVELKRLSLDADAGMYYPFESTDKGEWIRVITQSKAVLTAAFNYTSERSRGTGPTPATTLFKGIHVAGDKTGDKIKVNGGLLASLGKDKRSLGLLASEWKNGQWQEVGYYELNGRMELSKVQDEAATQFMRENYAIPTQVVSIEKSSVLIVDEKGRRWRFPKGNPLLSAATMQGKLRLCREVATERDLFHLMGTFYELPAENADGFAKVRPVSTHPYLIHDYASYRGLLVMTGLDQNAKNEDHIIRSEDGKAAVWAGTIDDLWSLGRPKGEGGPWADDEVFSGVPSDPYLIGFYENRSLSLSHRSKESVKFTVEVNPVGHGPWIAYRVVEVKPGETLKLEFPKAFQARWVRFIADKSTRATAHLTYL